MSRFAKSWLICALSIATFALGCSKPPDPQPPANIALAVALDVKVDQLEARAREAEKSGDSDEKKAVADDAGQLAGQIVQSGAVPSTLSKCKELAEKTQAKDVQALSALAKECKKQAERPPSPDRDENEVHRDRKLAAVALKLAALVALAYGNPELAGILWSLGGEVGEGKEHKPSAPPWVDQSESIPDVWEGESPPVPAEKARANDLPGSSGLLIANIDWNLGKVSFRNAVSDEFVADFDTAAVSDWTDPQKQPVRALKTETAGGKVVSFAYVARDGSAYILTPLTGKAEPFKAQ